MIEGGERKTTRERKKKNNMIDLRLVILLVCERLIYYKVIK